MQKKLALLIVEGGSDAAALVVPIRNYLRNCADYCTFEYEVYMADITLHNYSSDIVVYDYENIMNRVSSAVDEFINSDQNSNKYQINDVGIIMTLSDLDCCYCGNESVVFGGLNCLTSIDIINKKIICNDVNFIRKRNEIKSLALGIMSTENKVILSNKVAVPFHAFYCGTNLEHTLYNDIAHHTMEEKTILAKLWASNYKKDHIKFYETISSLPSISSSYNESWNEKELAKNAFSRITNLKIMIDWVVDESKKLYEIVNIADNKDN